ncbi:MAG: hypothetical protein O2817_08235 [Proteobacteria bacterium]|nr:hypothetical protein [Pseudomonadota bacterium]
MVNLIKKTLAIGIVLGLSAGAQAQTAGQQNRASTESSISTELDCTKVEIKIDEPDQPLTAAERTALMDKAFYESLSRFDRCQAARLSSSKASSGQTAAGGSPDGSGGGGNSQSVASQSVQGSKAEEKSEPESDQSIASQSLTGTLPKQDAEPAVETQSGLKSDEKLSSLENIDASGLGSGKLPEDIPPVNNDSILEKQIRTAAMTEKDPTIKAKLWNEYRKYKGLPLVKAGEPPNPKGD